MTWSKNNRAHRQTWYTLVILNELGAAFPEAKDRTVSNMTFWSTSASQELRAQRAEALAIQMDNMFSMIWNAAYEEGVDRAIALAALTRALGREACTVAELGAIADVHYRFLGEPDA